MKIAIVDYFSQMAKEKDITFSANVDVPYFRNVKRIKGRELL